MTETDGVGFIPIKTNNIDDYLEERKNRIIFEDKSKLLEEPEILDEIFKQLVYLKIIGKNRKRVIIPQIQNLKTFKDSKINDEKKLKFSTYGFLILNGKIICPYCNGIEDHLMNCSLVKYKRIYDIYKTESMNWVPFESKYITLESRLKTLEVLPKSMNQSHIDLALSGFRYDGKSDEVICFNCGGGLSDWEKTDDPFYEHKRWFPSCHRVLFNEEFKKGYETFLIKEVNEKEIEQSDEIIKTLTCKICLEHQIDIIFEPCSHIVCCSKCFININNVCPFCKCDIITIKKVYM